MTDRVLTDKEADVLIAGVGESRKVREAALACVRAVEAAVLAKVGTPPHFTDCYATVLGYVTEREARTRERAAALQGLRTSNGYGVNETEWLRRFWPLPTTTRPRTVTLSDGTVLRCTENSTQRQVFEVCVVGKLPQYWSDCGDPLVYTFAKTPADARLLADLVEHPFEEIDDA